MTTPNTPAAKPTPPAPRPVPMTGLQHYREAQQLLHIAARYDAADQTEAADRVRQTARLHTNLSQTAAALATIGDYSLWDGSATPTQIEPGMFIPQVQGAGL